MKVSNHSDSAPPLRVHSLGEPRKHFLKKSVFSCNSTARQRPRDQSLVSRRVRTQINLFKKKSSFSFGLPFPSKSRLAPSPLCISASNLAAPGHGRRWKVPPCRAYYRSDSPGRKPRRIQRAAISDAEPAAGRKREKTARGWKGGRMSDGAGVTAEARRRNLNNQEGGGEKKEKSLRERTR